MKAREMKSRMAMSALAGDGMGECTVAVRINNAPFWYQDPDIKRVVTDPGYPALVGIELTWPVLKWDYRRVRRIMRGHGVGVISAHYTSDHRPRITHRLTDDEAIFIRPQTEDELYIPELPSLGLLTDLGIMIGTEKSNVWHCERRWLWIKSTILIGYCALHYFD